MSALKIVVLTIVTTFVVCGHDKIIAAQKFGREQFLGRWYEIGRIAPPYAPPIDIRCGKYNITRKNGTDNGFKEVYTFLAGRIPIYCEGYGQIIDSEMNVTVPVFNQVNLIYTVTTYNDGREIIINKKDEKNYYGLLSRGIEVSETTKQLFGNLAVAVGVEPYYVPHEYCMHDFRL